ncbi:hypothetical protein [Fonticella tunisiensis]|uniref:Uncharacterized protein n=1 Tax=Fonticella tunisiensis TaxID=1096341 RepID=A0A4R7KA24_9CLOT|nr:hypothetical protein [Fonticella tunisiensis]TDT51117.1 hypothetical protein EDD71_12143 [Fonticella tunisiensis]
MLNSIRDKRIQRDGLYELTLQIPEDEYFSVYDTVTIESAQDILQQFLDYHQDDGRPDEVDINYNKNGHVVNITANLHYIGNEHTEPRHTPNRLTASRRDEGTK